MTLVFSRGGGGSRSSASSSSTLLDVPLEHLEELFCSPARQALFDLEGRLLVQRQSGGRGQQQQQPSSAVVVESLGQKSNNKSSSHYRECLCRLRGNLLLIAEVKPGNNSCGSGSSSCDNNNSHHPNQQQPPQVITVFGGASGLALVLLHRFEIKLVEERTTTNNNSAHLTTTNGPTSLQQQQQQYEFVLSVNNNNGKVSSSSASERYHFIAGSRAERDHWIQSIYLASFDFLRSIQRALRETLVEEKAKRSLLVAKSNFQTVQPFTRYRTNRFVNSHHFYRHHHNHHQHLNFLTIHCTSSVSRQLLQQHSTVEPFLFVKVFARLRHVDRAWSYLARTEPVASRAPLFASRITLPSFFSSSCSLNSKEVLPFELKFELIKSTDGELDNAFLVAYAYARKWPIRQPSSSELSSKGGGHRKKKAFSVALISVDGSLRVVGRLVFTLHQLRHSSLVSGRPSRLRASRSLESLYLSASSCGGHHHHLRRSSSSTHLIEKAMDGGVNGHNDDGAVFGSSNIFSNTLYKRFTFKVPTSSGANVDLLLEEFMSESKFAFSIPQILIKLYAHDEEMIIAALEALLAASETPPAALNASGNASFFFAPLLAFHRRWLATLQDYLGEIIHFMAESSFRSSRHKTEPCLQFVPTNFHRQSCRAVVIASSGSSSGVAPSSASPFFTVFTHGSYSAHHLGYERHGGMQSVVSGKNESLKVLDCWRTLKGRLLVVLHSEGRITASLNSVLLLEGGGDDLPLSAVEPIYRSVRALCVQARASLSIPVRSGVKLCDCQASKRIRRKSPKRIKMTAPLASYWRKVDFQYGSQPKPRHGHRAVTFKNDMVIFGGGNEGIIEEFSVFRHAEQRWFSMPVKGDVPPGCAAFGFTNDETRAWIFGGMLEYGKYSNELYELKLCNWECRRLKPRAPKNPNAQSPKARLGHSFNLIGNKIYLFGGLANDSPNPKQNLPKYLNDLYTLEIKANGTYQWDLPVTAGVPPCPRESHSAVAYFPKGGGSPKLIIYGGMCGLRLQDLWILEIETLTWSKPYVNGIPPAPRSLHSANVIGEKMYIFGGWVPMLLNPDRPDAVQDKEWRCTNTVAVFDIPSNTWEYVSSEISDESAPKARAGHCAVSIGSRVMIFSGRDGYRKAWNNQVCCKDLWILETSKPAKPERIVLTKSGTSVLEITWGEVTEADKFLVQIQKVDPKEYEASVKELNEETTMSGIGVLAAAAAAQTPQKILATPIKGNPTAGAQTIRYITPSTVITAAGGGGGANVKIPANLRLIANMPGGGGSGAKLVLKSPAGGVGGLQSGTFTLVKTPQGMALANTGGGGTSTPQLLRVVSSSSSSGGGSQVTLTTNKSSTTSSSPLTTTISPVITGSGGTAKTGTATPNVRMIVVPQGGNGTPRLTGLQLAPGAKTVRFPASTLVNGGASGTQRIVLSPGAQQIRLVASPGAAGASSQRFVVLSAGQTPTTNTPAAAVTSSTTKTSSSGGATTKTTNSTETILIDDSDASPATTAAAEQKEAPTSKPSSEMIPQTDGADDDDFSESTNSNNSNALSSSQQDSAIENAVASISSLEPPPPPQLLPRPTSPLLTPEHPLQSSEDESNSGDCELLPKPSTSSNSSTAAAAATTASSESSTATGTSATSADSAVNGNGSSSSGQQSTTTTTEEASKKKPPSQVKYATWYNVGTFSRNSCSISKFLVPGDEQCLAAFNPDGDLTSTTILNYDNFDQVNLEPGVAYKIRVCGINTRGRGEWSEPCTLKTAQLGYPPPPSSIKITKVNNGVNISWTIPQSFSQNDVTDYSVYLGVNNESAANANAQAFQLVYQSAATTCFVSNETLAKAWTNPNPKPAILFRITARNAKGYGPATQIRWLQDAGKRPLPAAKVSETPPSTKKNKS